MAGAGARLWLVISPTTLANAFDFLRLYRRRVTDRACPASDHHAVEEKPAGINFAEISAPFGVS
ncbi:hypothetical protein DSL92_06895 [Billgrantia gudaonensis]|uniref:Uncharacterized protein n=1 Tax=Billgrantia gudaonensis TaxID=376427 RepID=A0A3S0QFR6_9GAMM|nr:hypothetical protein DSL92_06895 [Halomonas gudaonensis]